MGCVICTSKGFNIKHIDGFDYNICKKCGHVYQENIKEYVRVPKSDGSGGYDTVLLKDL